MEKKNMGLLLADYFRGRLSGQDEAEVENWIRESEENAEQAKVFAYMNQISAELDDGFPELTEKALDSTHRQICRNRRHRTFARAGRIVLAVLVAGVVFGAAHWALACHGREDRYCTVSTATGVTTSTVLPDGTQVWLNSNSQLTYPLDFSRKERVVRLEGEAYFKVAPQGRRRFIVDADEVKIAVKGTEFDVEAYDKPNKEIHTTLRSGDIDLYYRTPDNETRKVSVHPHEEYTYQSALGKLSRRQVDASAVSAWRDGVIIYNNTPLSEALRKIENQFNVSFVVKNGDLLKNTYTGSFKNQRLDVILNAFQLTSNVHFDTRYEDLGDLGDTHGRQVIVVYN